MVTGARLDDKPTASWCQSVRTRTVHRGLLAIRCPGRRKAPGKEGPDKDRSPSPGSEQRTRVEHREERDENKMSAVGELTPKPLSCDMPWKRLTLQQCLCHVLHLHLSQKDRGPCKAH